MTLFDLVAKLTLDSSEYEQGIAQASGSANGFADVLMGNLAAKGIGAVVKGLANATKELFSFAQSAVDTGMGFDNAMSQVAATMGTTVDQIQQLRDFAQEMGATTKFTATEAAEALNYMALAGYDAEKSMSMLPTVLNLASAGAMDLARASDMVTDAESALGLTTEETVAMVDQMAKAASKSNTSVEQLGDAMLTIGGTAKFMAGGTDRLATVLGILADNGIKGSEAGTHLRNMLLKLSAPTDAGAKMIAELGLQIYDASGNMRDMQDIILDLSAAMEGMTDQEKINIISELFNARDVAAVNALLNTSVDRWNELGAAIKDSKGAADAMAATQLDNLNGDITIMKSALDGVKIAFSDGITPAIRDVVQRVTKALSNPKTSKFLKEVGQRLGELTKEITHGIGNAIPKVIKWFDEWGDKLPIVGAALAGLVLAIKATVNPIGALVSGLALVAGGMAVASLTADDYNQTLLGLTNAEWDAIQSFHDMHDAYEDAEGDYAKKVSAIESETQATQDLWNELQSLVGANGEVQESDAARVDYILGELNAALGTEYSRNGELIEQYGEMAAAIDNLIKKRQAESLLSANEDLYKQAMQNKADAVDALSVAYDTLSEKQQAAADAEAKLAAFEAENAETLRSFDYDIADLYQLDPQLALEWENLQEAVTGTNEALAAAQGEYDSLTQEAASYFEEVNRYRQAEAELAKGNYDEAIKLLEDETAYRWQNLEEQRMISAEELALLKSDAEKKANYAAWYKEQYEAGVAGFTAEELAEAEASAEELNSIWESKVALAKEGAQRVGEESGQAYADGLSGATPQVDTASNGLAEAARSGLDISKEAEAAGYNAGLGLAKGIRDSAGEVQNAANYVAGIAANAMRTTLQIKSPSRVAMEIGEFFGEGFALGMESMQQSVIERAKALAQAARDNLDTQMLTGYADVTAGVIRPNTNQHSARDSISSGITEVLQALQGIRDNIGGNVVLDDGTIVGHFDGALGQLSAQKARGLAWLG